MGAKLAGGGGGRFNIEQNSEINVTPFVDVMLVLLIIFMVAAPLATVSVKVDLPPAVAIPSPNPPKPIYISIQKDGSIHIGDFPTDLDAMGGDLRKQVGTRDPAKERIYIRADKEAIYGDFMNVMNKLQDNGFYSVVVSSPYGSVTNVAEQLSVNPADVTLGFYPGLTITAAAGDSYLIQRSADLSNTNNWTTLTPLTLTQPVQQWIDTSVDASSPFNNRYFYRLVPQQ